MATSSVLTPVQGSQPSFNPSGNFQPRHQFVPRAHTDILPGGHGSFFRPRYKFQPRFPPNNSVSTADDGSISYDGKRMRKAIHRKTVDYNPSIFKYLQNRIWQRDRRDEHQIQPDALYSSDILPPSSMIQKPMNCVSTKFVRTSTNKFRCPVFCLSWTPEGRRLVTGASSGEFTLWNGLLFNFETILQAHETSVRAMQWSHSDTWMVTADHAGYIKYWQSNMNNVKMYQAHKESIRGISFCPSDSKFASCSDDGTVRVWDFMRCHEERVLRGHGADVRCVDWHPQKGLLASGSKDNQQPIKLWDPRTGNSLATIHAHKHTVMDLKWHQNGSWMLTASRDHLVKLFDLRNMKEEMQTFKGHKREATAISWHPIHESLFASGSADGALMFWMVGCDHEVGSMEEAHEGMIWDLAWHPLGHILASGSNDHSTKFWTRNRPGDDMRDKYNMNSLPLGNMEAESTEQTSGESSSMPSLPGMGLEHGLPEHLIKEEDKKPKDELPSIPGLDWEADEAFIMAEQRAANKKVPYSRPVPKVFEQHWSGEIDLEVIKKERQEKDLKQKQIQAQLDMKKKQPNPNLILAARHVLGAIAGSIQQQLSASEAARMLIPTGVPVMMRPQGPRVMLAPGQPAIRQPGGQMIFVPGGPRPELRDSMADNPDEMIDDRGMPDDMNSMDGKLNHGVPGGPMNQIGPQSGPNQMGPRKFPSNQKGLLGAPPNQSSPYAGHPNQMGPLDSPQLQLGPNGGPQTNIGPHNQIDRHTGNTSQISEDDPQNRMFLANGPPKQIGPKNQIHPHDAPKSHLSPEDMQQNMDPHVRGPQGGPHNQMGHQGRGVSQNYMDPDGGLHNQMSSQKQNQMGGPQNQMKPRGIPQHIDSQNQMGISRGPQSGPQNLMGPGGGTPNQMGPNGDQYSQNDSQGSQQNGGFQQPPNSFEHSGAFQNRMRGPQGSPRNQMSGPQNQMFRAQGNFQNQPMGSPQSGPLWQMRGPKGGSGPGDEMDDNQTPAFLRKGQAQHQFGGVDAQDGDFRNHSQALQEGRPGPPGQTNMGRPDSHQHGEGMDKDERFVPQRNIPPPHRPLSNNNRLDDAEGMEMDIDLRGGAAYDGSRHPQYPENAGMMEDQDYRHLAASDRPEQGRGRFGGIPQGREMLPQGGSQGGYRAHPERSSYGGDEEIYDSNFQDSRPGGSRGWGQEESYEDEQNYGDQEYNNYREEDFDQGNYMPYQDKGDVSGQGRKRPWDEGPGGTGRGGGGPAPGYRERGRGRGNDGGDVRGGRGSPYRGHRGGGRGRGGGGERGGPRGRGAGRGRGGY